MKDISTKLSSLLSLAILAIVLAGCATMESTKSGFLVNYEQLEAREDTPNHKEFIADGIDWSSFSMAKIEPVKSLIPEKRASRFEKKDLEQLREDAQAILEEVFAEKPASQQELNGSKFCVRAAITNVDSVNVGMNAITSVLAVPVDNGGVSVEIEILDAATNERLLAYSSFETGKLTQVGGFFNKLGHAKSGFRKIAQRAADATGLVHEE